MVCLGGLLLIVITLVSIIVHEIFVLSFNYFALPEPILGLF